MLDKLLMSFDDVLAELHGLPLARDYDHWIHLLPSTAPVAMRPYHTTTPNSRKTNRKCSAPPCSSKGISLYQNKLNSHLPMIQTFLKLTKYIKKTNIINFVTLIVEYTLIMYLFGYINIDIISTNIDINVKSV